MVDIGNATGSPSCPAETIAFPKKKHDRSKGLKTGDSIGFGVRTLTKKNPAMLEKVKAGELTIHRAMIEAALKPKTITVPIEPAAAGRRRAKHGSQ